jgi:hypothetical protein
LNTRRTQPPVQLIVLLSIVMFVLGAPRPASAQPATEEYKVKAAFLFHFAQLVDWPATALNAAEQSLNLCVLDDEPRLQELQSTVEGKLVGTRVMHVRLLSQSQGAQGCNILFLSRDEGRHQAAILRSLSGRPVLTVGETDSFISDGGMIQLHIEDDKIRFDINVGAADSSHLKISSRLLLLATSVTLAGGSDKGRQTYAR